MAEIHHGMANINEYTRGFNQCLNLNILNYYKEIKKNLTNKNFSDKGEDNEKIQNKTNRTRNRSSSDNTIRGRTNNRKDRK